MHITPERSGTTRTPSTISYASRGRPIDAAGRAGGDAGHGRIDRMDRSPTQTGRFRPSVAALKPAAEDAIRGNEGFLGHFEGKLSDEQLNRLSDRVVAETHRRMDLVMAGRTYPDKDAANETALRIARMVMREAVANPENFL